MITGRRNSAMAYREHLEILKQGVDVWNQWRKNNITVRPSLTEADLQGGDFKGINLRLVNLTAASFSGADLSGANLCETKMIFANLTDANITAARLYGSARDDWKIDGIKCDYIYLDPEGKERIPKDRDFKPGEFEELYKSLPTIDYYFEDGFTPIDAVIMDKVVQAINERHPEFELKLDSFHSRGQPHVKFTVAYKEVADQAIKQIVSEYETRMEVLEGKKDQLMEVIALLSNKADEKILKLIERMTKRPQAINIINYFIENYSEGDIISLISRGHIAFAKDDGKSSIKIESYKE